MNQSNSEDKRKNPRRKTNAKEVLARRHHIDFLKYCWQSKDPLVIGRHTKAIADRIDYCIGEYRAGRSTYTIVTVPPRHGKSDLISRFLAPHFLGEFPDREIMLISHSADMAESFSSFARGLISTPEYQKLYDVQLSQDTHSVSKWALKEQNGKTYWAGIGTGISGKGLDCGIIDDFFGKREDAESAVTRQKQWEWFGDTFMSRCAPVCMVFILATRWHVDDLIGRIINKNTPSHADYNSDFPRFELLKFPALSDGQYLFPERFSEEWYRGQFASAGKYGTASLYQCEPIPRGGNLFEIDKIGIVESDETGIMYRRAWDLASTEKERNKTDPDYTVGALVGVSRTKNAAGVVVEKIHVKNIRRIQCGAPERDRIIKQTADLDGPAVTIGIEGVAGYMDTYQNIRDWGQGKYKVQLLTTDKDKIVRAQPLEAIIEAGNFTVKKAEWNMNLIDEMAAFPNGNHDDQVDAVAHAYEMGQQIVDVSHLRPITAKQRD